MSSKQSMTTLLETVRDERVARIRGDDYVEEKR